MITTETTTVYYSSLTNRRYLTKKSAIDAETNAIIKNKYPTVEFCTLTGDSFYYKSDLENYDKLFRRLRRLVKRSLEGNL